MWYVTVAGELCNKTDHTDSAFDLKDAAANLNTLEARVTTLERALRAILHDLPCCVTEVNASLECTDEDPCNSCGLAKTAAEALR